MIWNEISREKVLENKIFSLFDLGFESPMKKKGVFHVLETRDWVNVILKTPEEEFIIVKQFRFGSNSIEHEFVAGVIDTGEDPKSAAIREALEECGVNCQQVIKIGISKPNPAFINNTCHHFLIEDAVVTDKQSLDEFEEIEIVKIKESELVSKIKMGEFNHSLSLSAWALYKLQSNI